MNIKLIKGATFALAAIIMTPFSAIADSIDPAVYATTLGLGDSVTIRKTVTITKESPTTAPLDVMFIFDTTGSMGTEINQAKAAANSILTGLAGFGLLQSGSGWYNDPTFDGVRVDLNSGNTDVTSGISTVPFISGSGGDTPEMGYAGISDAADTASWRPGSNRFIIAFGDANFKTPPTEAATIASLTAANANLIGISYDGAFSADIADLGGTAYSGVGLDTAGLVTTILNSVGTTFDTYSAVTVDDLGGGMPGVGFSATCVSADSGACVGGDATGSFDRSVERTFEYDVTFTGMAEGVHGFDTLALVDGSTTAAERDTITVSSVPEPGMLALLGLGLIGMGATRKRRS
ncbi:hypothetical protein DUF1555 [Psychromonas ingrahamii 37]|uniref:Uncharacterized protein n=1 Tax=Psychromonas ingrahamii (strain DSM 17664 / CCUG 51855 / 37) TaxID=357804 RepID=A1SUZ9_PSYIN|nr:vWA domain-containing protein [Psychromonas ingrahamii]ABM03314.1 hypothetical protein DUF1555 [Psychromonas ingrahamii 37]